MTLLDPPYPALRLQVPALLQPSPPDLEQDADPLVIASHLGGGAPASLTSLSREPARARVDGRHERAARRELHGAALATYGHKSVFQRLPESFQHIPGKLNHLIQEQDSKVCQRHLPRTRNRSPSHNRRAGCAVMRCPEGPAQWSQVPGCT